MLQWYPNMVQMVKYSNANLYTDFCKTKNATKDFIHTIWSARLQILKKDDLVSLVDVDKLQEWDLYSNDQLIVMIMKMASTFENLDVDGRHDNDVVLAVSNLEPRARLRSRRLTGLLPEEKAFLDTMDKLPDHTDFSMTSSSNGLVGSTELKVQLRQIQNARDNEFFCPPIDVCLADWLLQRQEISSINRLKQIRKVIVNIELAETGGELNKDISDAENELLGVILDSLDQLTVIQKEKMTLKHIPANLLNDKCFPEIAKILSKENKSADIDTTELTSNSIESWEGSWSSD